MKLYQVLNLILAMIYFAVGSIVLGAVLGFIASMSYNVFKAMT